MNAWRVAAGLILVALGVIFTLNNLGITDISIGRLIRIYWPVILIILGLLALFSGRRERVARGRVEKVVGDVKFGDYAWELRDLDIQSGIGEVRLDLTRARILPGETKLNVSQAVGSVKILVPLNLALSGKGSVVIGSVDLLGQRADGFLRDLTYTSPGYEAAETRVRFDVEVGLGEARITRVG